MTTVEDLIRSPKAHISAKQAAEVLGYATGYKFTVRAKCGWDIGFRYFWRGSYLRINKADVLGFLGWYEQPDGTWKKEVRG